MANESVGAASGRIQLLRRLPIAKAAAAVPLLLSLTAAFMAQSSATPSPLLLVATSDNVSGAGETIKINVMNWSTDMDRDKLVAAWTLAAPAPARGGGARGGGRGGAGAAAGGARGGGAAAAGGARGGARGGRGGGAANPPALPAPGDGGPTDPVADDSVAATTGRGGARGGATAAAPTPAGSLTAALQNTTNMGYLWTSENVGYSLRYVYRLTQPDGGERIILATDRRLGASNGQWKPTGSATPTNYEFTVIELHLNAKHEGEGKASLTGNVAVDDATKTISLENYGSLPIVLKGVKPR